MLENIHVFHETPAFSKEQIVRSMANMQPKGTTVSLYFFHLLNLPCWAQMCLHFSSVRKTLVLL
jgi:hypothetical protein